MTDNPPEILNPNRAELVSVFGDLVAMSAHLGAIGRLMQNDEVEICSECESTRFINWPEHQAHNLLDAATSRIEKALALLTAARHIAP